MLLPCISRQQLIAFLLFSTISQSQSWVTITSPPRNANNIVSLAPIVITGTSELNGLTITPANIRLSGTHSGTIPLTQATYDNGTKTITVVPSKPYVSGEKITLVLTEAIKTVIGTPLKQGVIQYHAAVEPNNGNFFDTTRIITLPEAYGMSAVDADNDGFTDVIVNDLAGSVFIYQNNKNKSFSPVKQLNAGLTSTYAGKLSAADFDGDTDIDIVLPIKWGQFILFTNNNGTYSKKEFNLSMGMMNPDNMITAELADFNSDGLIDVAEPNGNNLVNSDLAWSAVTIVAMNNGNGTFTNKAITNGGGGFGTIASGDIDNDGDLDLAVTNVHNGSPFTISILKNDGAGNYTKSSSIIADGGSRAFTFADMDNDGDLDFAFSSYLNGANGLSTIAVYENLGSGSFSTTGILTPVSLDPTDLRSCDLNGDGKMDLVVSNHYSDSVTFLIRANNNSFSVKAIATAEATYQVAPADFDNDGDPDMAVLCKSGVQIIWNESIRVTPGYAHFGVIPWNTADTAHFTIHNLDLGTQASVISASLLNPGFTIDGMPATIPANNSSKFNVIFSPITPSLYSDTLSLTIANSETLRISIPLQGTSQPVTALMPQPYSINADTGTSISAGVAFPINAAGLSSRSIAVHGSTSPIHAGSFLPYDQITKILTFDPLSPFHPGERVRVSLTSQVKDVNGDSLATPVVWEFDAATYQGSGKFIYPLSVTSSGWTYITLHGDFNGDGWVDLVNVYNLNCLLFLNDGKGKFTYTSSTPFGAGGGAGAVGDIDNNGTLDILLSQGYWQAVQVLKNDGTGKFTAQPKLLISPYSAQQLKLADMDNDGFLDIVAVNDYSMILVALNDQNGSFGKQYNFRSGRYTNRHCIGDLDGDGDLDVVASAEGELFFHRNNGNGILSIVTIDTITVSISSLITADVNNDHLPDIIVGQGNSYQQSFYVLYNTGNFTFTKTMYGTTGKGTGKVEAADFDSDGDMDIAVKNFAVPTMDLYTNSGGDFSGIVNTYQAGSGMDMIAADFSGDGAIDIALRLGDPQTPNSILRNRRRSPSIVIKPGALGFGASVINKTVFKNLRIFNEGSESELSISIKDLTLNAFGVSPDSVTIGPYDSIDVLVTFLPTQGIDYLDTVTIRTNDPINPLISVVLSGKGVAKPDAPLLSVPADSAYYIPIPSLLVWQNNPAADRYHIQVYKESLAGPLVAEYSSLTVPSVNISSLTHATKYLWRVSAINIAGEGSFSPPRTFTTFKRAPQNLKVTMKDFQTAMLTWDPNPDPANQRYILYIGTHPDSLIRTDSASAEAQQMSLTGIPTGKIFYYSVTGIDTSGNETDRSTVVRFAIPYLTVAQQIGDANQTVFDADWGDFDNDNDLDLIITGYISGSRRTVLYRNIHDTLSEAWSVGRGIYNNIVEWGDFDGDGDIDLLHGNYFEDKPPFGTVTEIYINNGPGTGSSWIFTRLDTVLPGEYPTWIDFDNDGDMDVMVRARSAYIYQNDGPAHNNRWKFTTVDMKYLYLIWSALGDYDNNGTTDIGDLSLIADLRVLKNAGNGVFQSAFTDPGFGYAQQGDVVWADMNNDGLLDLCANGGNNPNAKTRIYFNTGAVGTSWSFSRTVIPNSTYENGKILAGDFDNDGWNDLIYAGNEKTSMLRNHHQGIFADVVSGIDSTRNQSVIASADFTNDGRLDVAAMAYLSPMRLMKNLLPPVKNTLLPPSGLWVESRGDTILLHWNPADDSSGAVTYNVYLHPIGAQYTVSPNADTVTGYRRIAENGNAGTAALFRIHILKSGSYRWSVQAVSGTYRGSAFAQPDTFVITPVSVERTPEALPRQFALDQNYPNPFNPETNISFALPVLGNVTIEIFNVLGQSLFNSQVEAKAPGYHHLSWNAGKYSSGVYFYRITVRDPFSRDLLFTQSKKMMLIR